MSKTNILYTQQELNKFAEQQWDKTLSFLQGNFSLSRTSCEDIFQESFIILYQNIIDGKLENMTSSLSTYFNAICRNKAFEHLRFKGNEVNIVDEYPNSVKSEFQDEFIDSLLALDEDSDLVSNRKSAIVRQLVKKLPDPCDKILWGFYRDGFSMKTMAQILNYKSEGSIKVVKHRCCDKFRNRFLEIANKLFD